MGRRSRRSWVTIVVLTVAVGVFAVVPAGGSGARTSVDPDLTTEIDFSGTGSLVSAVRTRILRDDAARGRSPHILLVGTGVQRSLFPEELQPSILSGSTGATTDTHGYGTVAASTIFQLLPDATITSRKVRAFDAGWDLLDLGSLAAALEQARVQHERYDAVLLAFPPNAALDPIPHLIGHGDYGRFGRGMAMVVEAMLSTPSATDGPVAGIPVSKPLRDRLFARANLKQRDALERFTKRALAWRRVVRAVETLSEAGIALVAPTGDFTRKSGSSILPLVTQTVFGIAALPSVITVGAAYRDGSVDRVSPVSGRGPTLALGMKPDLVAPSDVLALLPSGARLPWPDDSTRVPLQVIDWARPGVAPTPCPSVAGRYRCVLQGSSMVAASVVGANLAALVSRGSPNAAGSRGAQDDEVLRGIAWAAAGAHIPETYGDEREATIWEAGAGVLSGLATFAPASAPIPLRTGDLGEVGWDRSASTTVPVWSEAAAVSRARASVDTFLGPDASGAAVMRRWADGERLRASAAGGGATLAAAPARAAGGIYAGRLTLEAASGGTTTIPASLTQDVPLDFHVDYAYNELQGGGQEGERVERATLVLFAGLPSNVGLIGEAFKNFSSAGARYIPGGDPTSNVVIRYATTKDSFVDGSVPAREHGRGRIQAVPPGFYRMHVLSDHAMEAVQERGRPESLGIRLATSGPDAASTPGANLLISSRPACGIEGVTGPMSCIGRDATGGEVDRSSGLCVARNSQTQVSFHVYCGEIAAAVPTAMVSRAVHLIEHATDPNASEWSSCNVNVPLDGRAVHLGAIVDRARNCEGPTAPSSWSFAAGAPECLAPGERARFANGHPADVTATYSGPPLSGSAARNLPVAVLTYTFRLPYLNTYTIGGLALAYEADNAIVAARFSAGPQTAADAATDLLVVDQPRVDVAPALRRAATRGAAFTEWSLMSSNAPTGTLSLIVIPTAWPGADVRPGSPAARVQLCDVALRVATFAKQAWGDARIEDGVPVQHFPMLDRALTRQIDPTKRRIRPSYTGSMFTDAGWESEQLDFAIQVPKNTTRSLGARHHVRSPHGGPATFAGARRWGTDARRHEAVLAGDFRAYDPGYGVTSLRCTTGSDNPAESETCRLWNEARRHGAVLTELAPDISVNGRFFGVLPIPHDALRRAAGNVAFDLADVDDGGAFEGRWAVSGDGYSRRFPVGNFFDDAAVTPFSLSLLEGVVWFAKDRLIVRAQEVAGAAHTLIVRL